MTQQSIHDRIMSRQHSTAIASAEGNSRRRRKSLALALYSVLGAAAVAATGYWALRFDVLNGVLSQPAVAETKQPNTTDSPFLEHAKKAGLTSCSTVFPVLGELLANGSQYGFQSFWNTKAPDDHIIQAFVGMEYADKSYSGPAAGLVFAAPTGSSCEGSMVRVAPFSTSCENIPALLPQGSTLSNKLGQVTVYTLANNGGNALLLPNGNSCIVISVAQASKRNDT